MAASGVGLLIFIDDVTHDGNMNSEVYNSMLSKEYKNKHSNKNERSKHKEMLQN